MKKSELRKLIREELKNIKESDDRVYNLTQFGKALMSIFEERNHDVLFQTFEAFVEDPSFSPNSEMVDTYLQDISPQSEDLLAEAGLIERRSKKPFKGIEPGLGTHPISWD